MNDCDYMKRAIELAVRGRGMTNPNPVVGAVIVKGGRIIGEGWHQKYGGLHAERNAFASLTESAQGADMYVTLEPCCHYGKTPPCTDAILGHGIRRVVIGSRDPNPKVAGKGAKLLRDAGVIVEEDFMREECDKLNPVFFHYITAGTPYVIMKYAMTADGKIATKTGASKWITGGAARGEVHKLRSECMGIMAGIGTVLADDPLLNVRLADSTKKGAVSVNNRSAGGKIRRNPLRIICDSHLRILLDSQICRTAKEYPTMVVCAAEQQENEFQGSESVQGQKSIQGRENDQQAENILCQKDIRQQEKDQQEKDIQRQQEKIRRLTELGIEVVCLPGEDGKVDLRQLMRYLGEKGIDSILLEGGGELNDSALRAGIVQEVRAFIAPKLFGGAGAKTPVGGIGVELPDQAVKLTLDEIRKVGEDLMLIYRVK